MYVYAIVTLFLVTSGLNSGYAHIQNYLKTHSRLLGTLEHLLFHRSRHIDLIDNRLSNVLADKCHSYDALPLGRTAMASMAKVRRLAKDWTSLATIVGRYTALSDLGLNGVRWPGHEDVEAAANTVFTIQTTYAETSNSFAQTNVSLSISNSGLTALDCFNIALHFYKHLEPGTAEWLQLSLEKINNGDTSVAPQLVMAYKAAVTCSTGDSLSSATVLSAMLKELPDYKLPASLLHDYHRIVSRGCVDHEFTTSEISEEENEIDQEKIMHKRLCKAPESMPDGLRCRYVHYQQPHLRFQPFKLEELQLDPPLLRFYDVITDSESEILKEIAHERMEKARTIASDGGSEISDYRTSHVGWIFSEENSVTYTLQQRIADITGMNLTYAEPHQISRYGVGGEYKPHNDHFGKSILPYEHDRLATLMFYLNNVTQGGNTVFPRWKLTVAPVKNSAVLWFHFLPSGEEDLSSIHSGCPVIEGEKWVLNKWIHNIGNEFQFPCRLNKNGTYMDYYCENVSWRFRRLLISELRRRHTFLSVMNNKETHVIVIQSHLLQHISQRSFNERVRLKNPLTALVLVRRLVEDWPPLVAMVKDSQDSFFKHIGQKRWPDQKDLKSITKALVRIQRTYDLDITLLSQGVYFGAFKENITAMDCFRISNAYYFSKFFSESALWLQQALVKISDGDSSIDRQQVFLYLISSFTYSGDSLSSSLVLSATLKEFPKFKPHSFLIDEGLHLGSFVTKYWTNDLQLTASEYKENIQEKETHKALCKSTERLPDGLWCRYVHYQQPHLRFQPFKLEELQVDPPVLRFYNVISDGEAEELKNTAKNKMENAKTLRSGGGGETSDYRTSRVAWLVKGSRVIKTVQGRIRDITRMNMKFAEPHQISWYGVGGEFRTHLDSFGSGTSSYEYDRLATLMFYLNNVTQGGNTVFIDWKLTIAPVKNSAVLWFHFIPSGEEDLSSRHSGCPVLEGEKWVLNKWIHNIGNEFQFPCSLNKNGTYMDYYL